MTFVSRLLAVLDDIPDGFRWYDLSHLRTRVADDRLGTVRPARLHASMLRRIEAASEALSLNHVMRRIYKPAHAAALFPVLTPLTSMPRRKSRSAWGGQHFTFSVQL